MGDSPPLVMFFYGTLKRGERNHERFCGGALSVEEGTVRGDVYHLSFGYPALVVPGESICAFGTGDYTRDAEEQLRLDREVGSLPEGPRAFGEIFAFDDPELRLPALAMRPVTTGAYCSLSRRTRARSSWLGPTWSNHHQEATCLEADGPRNALCTRSST
ncbi:MAG: hypothetical protein K0Q96_298 [Rubrobacteraceae bacterium]|nr:hypothetical protein [Rubrobacteraceae bacterium]